MDLFALALNISSEGLEEAKAKLLSIDHVGEGIAKRFKDLLTPTNALKAGFFAAAAEGTKMFLGALDTAKQMSDAVHDYTRETGASVEQQKEFRASIEALWKTNDESVKEIGDALVLVQQKWHVTGAAAREAAQGALEYAEATGRGVVEAYGGLTTVGKAYNLTLEETNALQDQFVALSQQTGVTTGTLEELLARNAAAFRSQGVSVTRAAAILGTFATSGLQARRAANLLGAAVASPDFEKSGLTFDKAIAKIAGVKNAAERATVAGDIFGKAMGVQLAQALSKGTEGIAQNMAIMAASQGATARAADEADATFAKQAELLEKSLQGAFLSVADGAVKLMVGSQGAARAVAGIAGPMLLAITTAGTLALAFTVGSKAIAAMRAASIALEISLGPVGWTIAALSVAVGAYAFITGRAKGETDAFRSSLEQLAAQDASAFKARGDAMRAELAANEARLKQTANVPGRGGFDNDQVEANNRLNAQLSARNEVLRAQLAIYGDVADAKAKADKPGEDADAHAKQDVADSIVAAQITLARQRIQQQLAVTADGLARQAQLEQASYAQGRESLTQYYDARRAIAERGAAAELAALEAERAQVAKTPVGADQTKQLALRQQLEALDAQIAARRRKRTTDAIALGAEEGAALKQLAAEREQVEAKIATAEGRTRDAAQAGIDGEVRAYDELLAKLGVVGKARFDALAAYANALNGRADFDAAELDAQRAQADLALERGRIEADIARGVLSQLDGDRAIAEEERKRLPALRAIADRMLVMATAMKDPALLAAANAFRASLANIGEDLSTPATKLKLAVQSLKDELAQAFATLSIDVAGVISSTLGAGFTGGFKGAGKAALRGLGEIFTQMGGKLVVYGATMIGLLPALSNPFTSGPAALAAGTLLIGLGAGLGAIATGGSGGAGSGGRASVTLPDDIATVRGGQSAAAAQQLGAQTPAKPSVSATYFVVGPNDTQAQRVLMKMHGNALKRGITPANA